MRETLPEPTAELSPEKVREIADRFTVTEASAGVLGEVSPDLHAGGVAAVEAPLADGTELPDPKDWRKLQEKLGYDAGDKIIALVRGMESDGGSVSMAEIVATLKLDNADPAVLRNAVLSMACGGANMDTHGVAELPAESYAPLYASSGNGEATVKKMFVRGKGNARITTVESTTRYTDGGGIADFVISQRPATRDETTYAVATSELLAR